MAIHCDPPSAMRGRQRLTGSSKDGRLRLPRFGGFDLAADRGFYRQVECSVLALEPEPRTEREDRDRLVEDATGLHVRKG